jgi:hypothetical protein
VKELDYRCKELQSEVAAATNDFDEKMADVTGSGATQKLR